MMRSAISPRLAIRTFWNTCIPIVTGRLRLELLSDQESADPPGSQPGRHNPGGECKCNQNHAESRKAELIAGTHVPVRPVRRIGRLWLWLGRGLLDRGTRLNLRLLVRGVSLLLLSGVQLPLHFLLLQKEALLLGNCLIAGLLLSQFALLLRLLPVDSTHLIELCLVLLLLAFLRVAQRPLHSLLPLLNLLRGLLRRCAWGEHGNCADRGNRQPITGKFEHLSGYCC